VPASHDSLESSSLTANLLQRNRILAERLRRLQLPARHGEDAGAMIRDGVKSLVNLGVCSEKKWPYVITQFTKKPSGACFKEAGRHKVTSYHRILTLQQMKQCLAEGYPFVFGFTVYASFESQAVANSGIVPMPAPGEKVVGGHAVLAVGYDDNKQQFIIRNSWGTNWGIAGYFMMPYAYLTDSNLADDLWTIRMVQ